MARRFEPRPYQDRCITHLLREPAAGLLLDPGLGKTAVTLTALTCLQRADVVERMLVVAPLRVCHEVWPREVEKWTAFRHLSVGVLHGPKKKEILREKHDIYVINPEGLFWLKSQRWRYPEMLVVDESTKFKNTRSSRSQILRDRLDRFDRRVILTGTPTPNNLLDLYGQIQILDGGKRLGDSYSRYVTRYFYQTGFMGADLRANPDATEEVAETVGDICVRLKAEDYLKMPRKIVTDVPLHLDAKAMKVYEKLESQFLVQLDGGKVTAANAGAKSQKLRQVVGGAVYGTKGETLTAHTERDEACMDLVEEIGAPVIIAYEFKHERDRLRKMFPDAGEIGSGISTKKVRDTIDAWNVGELPVLLCHPASGGHGLNLQDGGHHIIWFTLPWNLEHYDQLNARLYRSGQKSRRVFIYHLMAQGTIDRTVATILRRKDRDQQALLDAIGSER